MEFKCKNYQNVVSEKEQTNVKVLKISNLQHYNPQASEMHVVNK